MEIIAVLIAFEEFRDRSSGTREFSECRDERLQSGFTTYKLMYAQKALRLKPREGLWSRCAKLRRLLGNVCRAWLLLFLLVICGACCGPMAGGGRWYYGETNRIAGAEDVKRDWHQCADSVDPKYGGMGGIHNAEIFSAPWIEIRECMIGKGYVYENSNGIRYPSQPARVQKHSSLPADELSR